MPEPPSTTEAEVALLRRVVDAVRARRSRALPLDDETLDALADLDATTAHDSDEPVRGLLIGYSEWLDADEGLVIVTEDDERTHAQLVDTYLEHLRDL